MKDNIIIVISILVFGAAFIAAGLYGLYRAYRNYDTEKVKNEPLGTEKDRYDFKTRMWLIGMRDIKIERITLNTMEITLPSIYQSINRSFTQDQIEHNVYQVYGTQIIRWEYNDHHVGRGIIFE